MLLNVNVQQHATGSLTSLGKKKSVYKQLLDEFFVISRILKVEVGVSRRLRLITLTETLIILDITKTESNYCFIIHQTKKKNGSQVFVSSLTASNTKRANLTGLPLEIMRRKFTVRFRPIGKEMVSLMYNNRFCFNKRG